MMGPAVAAITVACIVQRMTAINRRRGCLRALNAKAAGGTFLPGPMVMALLRSEGARAA